MGKVRGRLTIGDGRAMASHFTGIPLDDLGGFVIIAIGNDGRVELRHNSEYPAHLVGVLLAAVQMICDGSMPGPGQQG